MIRLLIILVLLVVAILFGHKLSEIEGRIVIDVAGTIIQLSLLGAAIVSLGIVLVVWLLLYLLKKLIRFVSGSRNWLGAFSSKQQTNAFYKSIHSMLLNENETARKYIQKSSKGEFEGTNFLLAAELEKQAGNLHTAKANLIQAMEYSKSEPIALFKQAELLISQLQYEEAMNILSTIEGPIRKTKAFVLLKISVLQGLNDWSQVKVLAKENKELLGDDFINLAKKWTISEFAAIASKQGANALKAHWSELSRAEKKSVPNQIAYVELLIKQGLSADAEVELLEFAKKNTQPEFWDLFKQINHANPSKSISFIEQEIKKSPNTAALYSVLGHLAYNSGDSELAQKAISKSLDLEDNRMDKALLATILESRKHYEEANQLYKTMLLN